VNSLQKVINIGIDIDLAIDALETGCFPDIFGGE